MEARMSKTPSETPHQRTIRIARERQAAGLPINLPPKADGENHVEALFAAMRKHDEALISIRKVNAIGRTLEAMAGGDGLSAEEQPGLGECLTDFAERAREQTEEAHKLVADVWRRMGGAR
jgi:hypothetical protein